MKIQFVQQHIVRGETRAEDVVYEKDRVVDFGKDRVDNSYAQAYVDRGYAVELDQAGDRGRGKSDVSRAASKLEARGKIVLPDDLSKVTDGDLINLGQSVSDDQVKTKDDALKAIETEKARRNPT
ncbi:MULTISPECIES: hypothetical protein [unclassified Bradyrhizobium]|uniref:hypothetical protein n=1 Tax=unclassified Bradyrhizobium TaxID=2631580 RepID=UPI001FFB2028|nr:MULTISPECIES: hypothetical protein [unclassified Bradyrhizobium]MCK1536873.1 hypothetical protein [Bradyrhizobium sp. 176]MCK1560176.1 hypothetical protein [Bradyrhizobium sp. 171]